MSIESLKRWQWTLIGALIGASIATTRYSTGAFTPLDPRPGLLLPEFLDLLSAPNAPDGSPALRHLTLYPPSDHKLFVTGEYNRALTQRPNDGSSRGVPSPTDAYRPFQLNTPVPFHPLMTPAPADPTYTLRNYLAENHPELSYRYAWYTSTPAQFTLWTLGTALLLGGLWPTLLNYLLGAGFGRQAVTPEPEYDLNRFSHDPDPTPTPPPNLTPEESAQVDAVARALEATLSTPDPSPAHTPTTSHPTPPPVSLSTTPYTPATPLTPHDDPKDYQGEFYPVARPTHATERN